MNESENAVKMTTAPHPRHIVLTALFLSLVLPHGSHGYCMGIGRNPYFTGPPIVEQVTISLVRLSWGHNIVGARECVDHFFVKYWPRNDPYNYDLTDIVAAEINYIHIKVRPRVMYLFEVIAREEKGFIGVDYNRAPHVEFQTSRRGVVPASPPPPPEPSPSVTSDAVVKLEGLDLNTVATEKPPPPTLFESEEAGISVFGLSIEVFVGLFVVICVALIVLSGGVYKFLRSRSGEHNLNEESVVADESDEEKQTKEEELKPLSPSIND